MDYIKSQATSDEAEASVIGPVMILALVLVAIVVIFGRLMKSTERKGSDVANCIAQSTSFAKSKSGTSRQCNDKNTTGHNYDETSTDY